MYQGMTGRRVRILDNYHTDEAARDALPFEGGETPLPSAVYLTGIDCVESKAELRTIRFAISEPGLRR